MTRGNSGASLFSTCLIGFFSCSPTGLTFSWRPLSIGGNPGYVAKASRRAGCGSRRSVLDASVRPRRPLSRPAACRISYPLRRRRSKSREPGDRRLDVGPDVFSFRRRAQDSDIVGLDSSAHMLAVCRQRLPLEESEAMQRECDWSKPTCDTSPRPAVHVGHDSVSAFSASTDRRRPVLLPWRRSSATWSMTASSSWTFSIHLWISSSVRLARNVATNQSSLRRWPTGDVSS